MAKGVQGAIECIRHKWAIEALHALHASSPAPQRLGEILRTLNRLEVEDTVWQNTLRKTLNHLHTYRLVERKAEAAEAMNAESQPAYSYRISDLGSELLQWLQPFGEWVHQEWPEATATRRG